MTLAELNQFEYDDQALTIQGVQFNNKQAYQMVKVAVINSYVDGWQPTQREVEAFKNFLISNDEGELGTNGSTSSRI